MSKLLLVEDEEHLRNFMMQCVPWEQLHITDIRAVANGEEALLLAETLEPDILITDIRMPGISGLELSKQLLERHSELRVIFMSAYTDVNYLRSALRMGSVDYLFKPVQMGDLEEAVSRAIADLEKLRQTKGSTTLVESYADQLQKPLLVHLLEGDRPVEELIHQLDMLLVREERGFYWAMLLSSMARMPQNCYELVARCVQLPGFAYCHALALSNERQAFLCCFEKPPAEEELELTAKQLATQLQVNGFAMLKVRRSRVTNSLSDLYGFAKEESPALPSVQQRPRVAALCDDMVALIHEHYASHSFGAGSIAQMLHYTNAYICTVFKQRFGVTIHDYINAYRIAKAKDLLISSSDTLATIAEKVGYENDSYFSRVFKKIEGISPSDYKRRGTR